MNRYKIEVKTNIKKEIIVDAETGKEALDFIEKVFLRTDLLDFSNKNINSVKAKVTEKNGKKIGKICPSKH